MLKKAAIKILKFVGLDSPVKDGLNKSGYRVNFALQAKNSRFDKEGKRDNLPLPPAELIYLVSGQHDTEVFYTRGVEGAQSIRDALKKNGVDIENFGAILDFGCGCGRVLRQWSSLKKTRVFGTDYNKSLIAWCQKNLPFAEFKQNKLSGRLDYANNQFDFIYAISVFTHLGESLQDFWINELARILKPGGYMYLTFHGQTRLHMLDEKQRASFKAGNFVAIHKVHEGSNLCGAYHPESYIREKLCKNLEVVDFIPQGARDAEQDVALIRKPL